MKHLRVGSHIEFWLSRDKKQTRSGKIIYISKSREVADIRLDDEYHKESGNPGIATIQPVFLKGVWRKKK
jgi:hypothetical protein